MWTLKVLEFDFYIWARILNEARDDGVAVASAGPYANYLDLAAERQLCQYLIARFSTGRMPNQQCQSTDGETLKKYSRREFETDK